MDGAAHLNGHGSGLYNSGKLNGAVGLGASSQFTNSGTVLGGVTLGASSGFNNSGDVEGAVNINDAASTFDNAGTIHGDVSYGGLHFNDSGAISGVVTLAGSASNAAQIAIAANASIIGDPTSAYAFDLQTGAYDIVNSGEIRGLTLDYSYTGLAYALGGGTLVNHGVLDSVDKATAALVLGDTQTSNLDNVVNDGSILGDAADGLDSLGGAGLAVSNSGSIQGRYAILTNKTSSIVNTGSIKGTDTAIDNGGSTGATDYIFNAGVIAGNVEGIFDGGPHTARIVNAGQISGGTGAGGVAIFAGATTQERLVNSGTISGAVSLGAAASTIVNSGAIDGDVTFGAGDDRLVNTGSIDGDITFAGTGDVYLGKGGSFTGTLTGAGSDGRYFAGAGEETFDLSASGAKLAVGGTGDAIFNYGATFTNAMAVQGGGGGTTEVDLTGNYAARSELFLGARTMISVDKIVLGAGFSYSIVANAATVANGATMTVDGSTLGASDAFLFDATRDVGGYYDLLGGAGVNTFYFMTYNLFANDIIKTGTGAYNTIVFKSAGTVGAQQFANVQGVSTLKLAAGTNNIQLSDLMVAKAYNHSVTVDLNTGADTIDASTLVTLGNSVTIDAQGASGGDSFAFEAVRATTGAVKDTVLFGASPSSNSVNYDTFTNFDFTAGDAVNITGFTPNSIDGAVTGSLSTATFDTDLAALLGPSRLGASSALLFTANAGTLAGDTFLIASTNGNAGYAAGDLVVRLAGTTTGSLGLANV